MTVALAAGFDKSVQTRVARAPGKGVLFCPLRRMMLMLLVEIVL